MAFFERATDATVSPPVAKFVCRAGGLTPPDIRAHALRDTRGATGGGFGPPVPLQVDILQSINSLGAENGAPLAAGRSVLKRQSHWRVCLAAHTHRPFFCTTSMQRKGSFQRFVQRSLSVFGFVSSRIVPSPMRGRLWSTDLVVAKRVPLFLVFVLSNKRTIHQWRAIRAPTGFRGR